MTDQKQQQVSEILTVIVKYNRLAEYEQWLKKTEGALAQQKGFLGIEVIRPPDITAPEYFMLLNDYTLQSRSESRLPVVVFDQSYFIFP